MAKKNEDDSFNDFPQEKNIYIIAMLAVTCLMFFLGIAFTILEYLGYR